MMKFTISALVLMGVLLGFVLLPLRDTNAGDVIRPEEIRSKRLVIYDQDTYVKLADLWEKYQKAFPSEYAYGNWVYAERYAQRRDFIPLVKKGLKKYPSNPLLLYLGSMERNNESNNRQGLEYLERAVSIDPNFLDPWFSLVTQYMLQNDDEKLDVALKRILESGYIRDDILDFNYNVLIGLEPNAVLITNGDNDTYPAWILQRILKVRTDVAVVNISLLNSDWYPNYVVTHGAPRFATPSEVEAVRKQVNAEMTAVKTKTPPMNPFAEPLMVKLFEAAARDNRPVYFALTLYEDDFVKSYKEKGRMLGLAWLVSPVAKSYGEQLRDVFNIWAQRYRTSGLDSWRLHSAKAPDAGKMLIPNYAYVAAFSGDSLKQYAPELRLPLFEWYRAHVEPLLNEDVRKRICQAWCDQSDVKEIKAWCDQQGCKN
jgi:hypothetical protein